MKEWDHCYDNHRKNSRKIICRQLQIPFPVISTNIRNANTIKNNNQTNDHVILCYLHQDQDYMNHQIIVVLNESHWKRGKNLSTDYPPSYQPTIFCQLSKWKVKRRIRFKCKTALLKYITIVCNANFETMINTTQSCITWFEEWFLLFKMLRGKTHTSVEDLIGMYCIANCTTS